MPQNSNSQSGKDIDEITIHAFKRSDGDYEYSVYLRSPDEVIEGLDAEDGGICTSNMENTIGMASNAARKIIQHSGKDKKIMRVIHRKPDDTLEQGRA